MATKGRKEEPHSNGNAKGTFRFRYMDSNRQFEIQADNVAGEALLEGFQHVANTIAGRALPAAPTPKLLKKTAGATEVLDPKDDEEALDQQPILFPVEPVEETSEEVEDDKDDNGNDKPKKVVKFKAPTLLSGLNLAAATLPLTDFMKQKNPDAMWDKYAVVAVWLKEQFKIADISIDHIFTAFKHLGWESQLPTDISKPLKNLTYNRKWFDVGKDKGTYAINWLGESEVGKMSVGATK
jgi:hypothetical protein